MANDDRHQSPEIGIAGSITPPVGVMPNNHVEQSIHDTSTGTDAPQHEPIQHRGYTEYEAQGPLVDKNLADQPAQGGTDKTKSTSVMY
ncbi:unnamed protein product [Aspergillus oryzae]|uniref:Unnamed protein product n=2 Tax=Aspergillus oryzae TaxID=5062 RepID=A0AAN5BX57_ASPOZ|nr:unnamed protein product [Aspergillus oryzae]GMF95135.1 unnamed protein product [Aspergillus oryzae]GMG13530.1 unnamed protein product [Aspergillus oryzae]GMG29763.1 unnamed protein product [Aspergillus oryzae]GMG46110.1 unnamed protein product [Aspergillus oryzae var. brunneus]